MYLRIYIPSSKHCNMLPAYDKQSDEIIFDGKTPRHNDKHEGVTPRRLQHGVWSRPPAAHLAIVPFNKLINK